MKLLRNLPLRKYWYCQKHVMSFSLTSCTSVDFLFVNVSCIWFLPMSNEKDRLYLRGHTETKLCLVCSDSEQCTKKICPWHLLSCIYIWECTWKTLTAVVCYNLFKYITVLKMNLMELDLAICSDPCFDISQLPVFLDSCL